MPSVFFNVVTWGASGSAWVAKLLNGHPDIFCSHALGQKARWQVDFGGEYSEETGLVGENALAYCRWLLVHAEGYRVAGDVHGIDLETWRQIRNRLIPFSGEAVNVREAVLIRHPILRIESYIALHRKYLDIKLRRTDFYRPYAEARDLARHLGLDWAPDDYEKLMFLEACHLAARAILLERRSGHRIFRLEDLTQGESGPQELLRHVSDGLLTAFPTDVVNHMQEHAVNRHRMSPIADPLAVFDQWSDWRQELFGRLFSPDVVEAYAAVGYQLPARAFRSEKAV